MVQLVFKDETLKGRSYDLVCEKTTIGRSSENLLCIRHPSISRRHCEILAYGFEVIVRDLGARNGTFVDGKRLSNQQCQVKSGQVISFGVLEARLDISGLQSEDDDPSGYFDVSKYQAELEQLRGRQKQSQKEWDLVKAHLDRTIEMHEAGASERTESVIGHPSNRCSKRYRSVTIGLIFFLSLAVSLSLIGTSLWDR